MKGNVFKTKEEKSEKESEDESEDESEEESEEERVKKFIKYIENKPKTIDYDFFKNYFDFSVPSTLVKKLYQTKNKKRNNKLVEKIKNRWRDLKDEINKLSEDEKEAEKPDKTLEIVKEIFIFNRENRKQHGLSLKILTPKQMLSRLPISLAQLKAVSNSEKLKNEIRQLFYLLYRSKKLTKQLYKSLIDII